MVVMPRGVYHSALRGVNLRSDQGKTVAGIPGFMLKAYEKNRQPGLKPGLAGESQSPWGVCVSVLSMCVWSDFPRMSFVFQPACC